MAATTSEYDWRRARVELEKKFADQLFMDRDNGRADSRLTAAQIRETAYQKACAACERAIRGT